MAPLKAPASKSNQVREAMEDNKKHDGFLIIVFSSICIRALSAQSAAEFNISPSRLQHVRLVAIVSPERWGEMDKNGCHTA
jgi:hypothetical protein